METILKKDICILDTMEEVDGEKDNFDEDYDLLIE